MAEALLDLEIARLRRDLRAVMRRGGELLFTVLVRVRDSRDREGCWILDALDRLGDAFDSEELHRIRIRARRMRYTAELQDLVKSSPSEAARAWKSLQERLGLVRDHDVLAQWFAGQAQRAVRPGQEALRAEAEALAAWFLEESRRHHAELLAARPGEIVQRALSEMGQGRTELRPGA
jgi:CHAD domain-containing protein